MCTVLFAFTFSMLLSCTFSDWYDLALLGAEVKHTLKAAAAGVVHNRTLIVRCVGEASLTIYGLFSTMIDLTLFVTHQIERIIVIFFHTGMSSVVYSLLKHCSHEP